MFSRRWICAVVALVVAGGAAAQTGDRKVRVVIRKASDRATAARFGSVADDYGSFVIVRMPASAANAARLAGLDFEEVDEHVGIGTFRFDPEHAAPAIPARFTDTNDGAEPRNYIVQFRGPIRESWVSMLVRRGAQPIQYVPDNALLVRATPAQIAKATRESEVRWSALFHPAYKLSDDLTWLLGKPSRRTQRERERFRVSAFRLDDIDAVVAAIERLGGKVRRTADVRALYFRSLIVEIDTDRIADLAAMREICGIETWSPMVAEDERSNQIVAGNYSGTTVPSAGYASFLSSRGVDGTGITVGVVDDGVDTTEIHLVGRVTDSAAIRRGAAEGADGHGHHDAGIVAGQCSHADPDGFLYGSGMAPQAHVLNIPFLRTGYTGDEADTQSDVVMTAAANGQTGTVSTNSWGTVSSYPHYGSLEALFDALVLDASATAGQQPLAIIFSAGNNGPAASTITSPKAAKNTLVVGATENYRLDRPLRSCGVNADNIDQWACFSSRGPTVDGRIRPDVSAPGSWIASARSGSAGLWGNIDTNHRWSGGTSQAAPHVAGATALIQQWWKSNHAGELPAPALSKAMIINGAVDPGVDAAGFVPNNTEGWGRMNLANVIATGVPAIYNNQQNVLTSAGETFMVSGVVSTTAQPFRATLVWSDAPGAVLANPALVNNLDLEVAFGETVYKGNVFASGVSTTGGTADNRNNVEAVYFPAGTTGSFTATVRATALAGDGAPGTGDATDQHFALVLFNATQTVGVPTGVTATILSETSVSIAWNSVPDAASYKVFRTSDNTTYSLVGSPTGNSFVDPTAAPDTAYLYRVRAVDASLGESGDSNRVLATTVVLTDPALVANATVVKAAHVAELRTAVDAVRVLAGMPAGTYTDPSLASSIFVKAVHFAELRTNLDAARTTLGLAAISYTDPAIAAGVTIKAAHVSELRDGAGTQ